MFPILCETGPINIPLICTCKKALLSVEDDVIDFGDVIYGEENTRVLKIKNSGALPAKIYVKTHKNKPIPIVTLADLEAKKAR